MIIRNSLLYEGPYRDAILAEAISFDLWYGAGKYRGHLDVWQMIVISANMTACFDNTNVFARSVYLAG